MIKPGRYLHYKGGMYIVLFTAQDSETKMPIVVYMNQAHGTYYVRSLEDFTATVNTEDRGEIARFMPWQIDE